MAKEKKVEWNKMDTGIQFSGRQIVLPGDPAKMPLRAARDAIERKIQDEEQIYDVHEIIDAYPHDAAVAFVKACRNLYSFSSPVSVFTESFFGKQERKPKMLDVKVGHRDTDVVQVAIGQFMLPGVEEPINTTFTRDSKGKPCFVIYGEVKKMHQDRIVQLANETRRLVKEESIYRGKAISLSVNDDGDLDFDDPPMFLDVSDTTEGSVLFDDDIAKQIHVNLLVPVKETELCRKAGIPLKRGVLLEGPYGTGKSLTARMFANTCEQNNWTYIQLDDIKGLEQALEFAKRYSPAAVFAEDVDRVGEDRDDAMNSLINTIDGVISKGVEVMVVLTTNHVEKLHEVILRPGRLDAVISLKAPSAPTVERLIRYYANLKEDLLDADADLTRVGQIMAGQIPASIRECVERAKLSMIGRKDTKLNGEDLTVTALTMQAHLDLLRKDNKAESPAETFARSMRTIIQTGNGHEPEHTIDEVFGELKAIADHGKEIASRLRR